MVDFSQFSNLSNSGFSGGKTPLPPEQEFFHSLYIGGKNRKNHIGVVERSGLLQIRGVDYNKDKVCMVITHVKEVLVKEETVGNQTSLRCFSYKNGDWPWHGTSSVNGKFRVCGKTSAERAADQFCNTCRSQILVAGIYTNENGKPITADDGKPIFMFLRGRGFKYISVSSYLAEMSKLELDPIFDPVTEESKKFEKSVVNNKRFVTEVSPSTASSRYGEQNVFKFEKGSEIPKDHVLKILQLSQKTLEKFNEKFDWSRGKQAVANYGGNDETSQSTESDQKFDDPPFTPDPPKESNREETKPKSDSFSFEDVEF